MTPSAPSRWIMLLVSAVLIVMTPAFAQKKKKDVPPPPPATQVEPSRQSQKTGGTIREILASLHGQQTNLGVLSKVAGDFVVFEADGDTLMYPISTVQVVKFLKTEEGEPRKIEIRFLSKD